MKDTTYLPQEWLETCQPPLVENLTPFTDHSITFVVSRLSGNQLVLDLYQQVVEELKQDRFVDFTVLSVINELPHADWPIAVLPIETAKKLHTKLIATDLTTFQLLVTMPTSSDVYLYVYDLSEFLNAMRQGLVLEERYTLIARTQEQGDLLKTLVKNNVVIINKWSDLNGS